MSTPGDMVQRDETGWRYAGSVTLPVINMGLVHASDLGDEA